MYLISHRGNLVGKSSYENQPEYINEALKEGFDVEIDVWVKGHEIFLGHDEPQYKINIDFLHNDKFWCHAKNYEALSFMLKNNIHCFWHQEDTFTLTSKGFIWQYPSNIKYNDSIFLMPEYYDDIDITGVMGVCSDYIFKYKKI